MSNLTQKSKSSSKKNLLSLTNIRKNFQALQQKPIQIILNPITEVAVLVGFFLGLVTDQLGQGYLYVFSAVLVVVIIGIFKEAQKFIIYQKESIFLPIVINISNPSNSENALNAIFNIIDKEPNYSNHEDNLRKILGIEKQDLIFNYSNDIFDYDQLQTFLKITRYNLEKLKAKTPQNTVIYLAYIGPICVAVLIGTLFGTDGVKIFQYNKSSNSYYPLLEISNRGLKEDIIEFEKFNHTMISSTKTQDKICVVIDASSHQISLENPAIANYGDIVHLDSKNQGTIRQEEDWLQYCREIFKVLNVAQKQGYKEIKLVYSMPTTLGIVVGMAAQQYWPILLTHYNSKTQTYQNLFALNDFNYYRGQ